MFWRRLSSRYQSLARRGLGGVCRGGREPHRLLGPDRSASRYEVLGLGGEGFEDAVGPGVTESRFGRRVWLLMVRYVCLAGSLQELAFPLSDGICPRGTYGELPTKGHHTTTGYRIDPDPTRMTLEPDGWMHIQDLCVVDDRDYMK